MGQPFFYIRTVHLNILTLALFHFLTTENGQMIRTILAVILAICVFTFTLSAQNVSIFGTVKDAKTLEPLIGVNIILEGTDKGTTSDLNGLYELLNVAPGSYNITASYIGYATITRSNVIIQSKGNDYINFLLSESGLELETVVVKANPFQSSVVSPLSLQRLSPEEIKTYPGGNNDIAKVVQSLPGVAGSVGGFRNDVIIRGGAPNENVYYLDGIEIPNINHFSTQGSAGGPAGILNVDFIEGVELSSSAFGAQYDNALSGVLQFDQKVGNKREYQTNLRVSASETALTTEGPLFKGKKEEANTSYIVSVRRSYLQFLFEMIGLPIRPDYWDYQYKINTKINDRNSIFLTGIGAIDDFSVKAPENFDVSQQAVIDQVPVIEQYSSTSGLGWRHRLKDGKGIMNTYLSVNILRNNFSRYQDNENLIGQLFNNTSQELEEKLRYNYTRFVNGWALTAGANLIYAQYSNSTSDLLFNNTFETNIDFIKYGIHAQASKPLMDGRLNFSFGFRMDDNTFADDGQNLFHTFSPRLSVAYALDKKEQFRWIASLGKYYKIAPYTILGYQDSQGNFANKDIPYIGSFHAVTGLEYRIGEYIKLSTEAFYKQYDHYPVSITDGISLANKGGDFSVLGNEDVISDGKGRTYGMEFLYQQKLYKNFYGILAYTYFYSEFTDINGDFLPSQWDSRHLLSFTGGYKIRGNWEISARNRFAGKTPFPVLDEGETLAKYPLLIYDYTDLGQYKLGTFNQLDIRIDKKWNFRRFSLNVYVEVQNVLAQRTPSPPSYGLSRNPDGEILQPLTLQQIDVSPAAVIPSIGIALDL